jgi:hypothetical protein
MSALEDRYRRLLRWYPADHRRAHEDEMLGVLLAAAEPGQTRPAVRDAFDLARGGLWVRLRRAPQAGWRDAAALLGVLAPLVLLTGSMRYALQAVVLFPQIRAAAAHGVSWTSMYYSAPAQLLWVVVAAAALCGARRTTTATALVAIVVVIAGFPGYDNAGATAIAPLLLAVITVGALLAGPGAARGRELLGRTGLIGIVVLVVLAAPLDSMVTRYTLGITLGGGPLDVAVAALLAAAWLARGPAGRRALVVLAVPLLPVVAAPYYPGYIEDPLNRYLIMVAIPAAVGLSALIAVVALERLVTRRGAATG